MANIVQNANRKVILRLRRFKVVKNPHNMFGHNILAAYAAATANDKRLPVRAVERAFHIQIQWFRQCAQFLSAIQHSNFFDALWNVLEEMLQRKRAIEMHIQQAHFFAFGVQMIHHFFYGLAHRAHGNDQTLRIRRSVVIEQVVLPPGKLADFRHVFFNNLRQLLPITIGYFPLLKMNIRILHGAAQDRMIRVERPAPEGVDRLHVQELA